MKKIYILILLLIFLFSQKSYSQQEIWTVGTAKTIPKKNLDLSVFMPLRYGITNTLEVFGQPYAFLILPNVNIKKMWLDKEWKISTVHGLNYPTIFLRTIRKFDIEKSIPRDTAVPQIVAFRNEILFSKMLKKKTSCNPSNYLLTIKLGAKFAYKSEKPRFLPILRPVIFQETSIYHDNILLYIGVDLDGHIDETLDFTLDLDFQSVGVDMKYWAIQHKGLLRWHAGKRTTIVVGYLASYGNYPDKNRVYIMPLIDLIWRFKAKRGKELKLFEE